MVELASALGCKQRALGRGEQAHGGVSSSLPVLVVSPSVFEDVQDSAPNEAQEPEVASDGISSPPVGPPKLGQSGTQPAGCRS